MIKFFKEYPETIYLIIGILLIAFVTWKFNDERTENRNRYQTNIKLEVAKLCEHAYFEGQKDAVNGDVRIKRIIDGADTCYMWTKNCWDDTTRKVQYAPPCVGNSK